MFGCRGEALGWNSRAGGSGWEMPHPVPLPRKPEARHVERDYSCLD